MHFLPILITIPAYYPQTHHLSVDLHQSPTNFNISKPEDHAESKGFYVGIPFVKNKKFKKSNRFIIKPKIKEVLESQMIIKTKIINSLDKNWNQGLPHQDSKTKKN